MKTNDTDIRPGDADRASRRQWLRGAATASLAGLALASPRARAQHVGDDARTDGRPPARGPGSDSAPDRGPSDVRDTVAFHGPHQAGIATPLQRSTYFIAFDVVTDDRAALIQLLKDWTQAAAELTSGPERFDPREDLQLPGRHSGAAVDLPASRLTLTFGLGPTLFERAGQDRFGLASRRPEALVDLPRFAGDQLVPERCGGDLSVQACADDFQVAEAAVRRLAHMARGVADMKWAQTGFAGAFRPGATGRNTMGFLDGTMNVPTDQVAEMDRHVWVGDEGPAWMRGGSYMVIRPIRIALDHWDDMKVAFQEASVGRHKASGAPLGLQHEHDALGLDRMDAEGNPVVPELSHAALSAPENNDGAQILRRAFSYDNGIARIAERWPPWRQHMTFDAGLLFQCYQKDLRTGFIKIFARMAQLDMLQQFTTHVGSAVFAIPPGVRPGQYLAQDLFEGVTTG